MARLQFRIFSGFQDFIAERPEVRFRRNWIRFVRNIKEDSCAEFRRDRLVRRRPIAFLVQVAITSPSYVSCFFVSSSILFGPFVTCFYVFSHPSDIIPHYFLPSTLRISVPFYILAI